MPQNLPSADCEVCARLDRAGYDVVDGHRPPASTGPDPRLASVATRCRSLRHEIDRLDDTLSLLDRDSRAGLDLMAAILREGLDELELRVERKAAGL